MKIYVIYTYAPICIVLVI